MTQEDRVLIARKIQEVSLMYGNFDLTREQISLMINLLIKVYNETAHNICSAFDRYMMDAKNQRFPAPAHLREYFKKNFKRTNPTQLAHEIASLIDKEGRSWVTGFYYDHRYCYWRGKDQMYWTHKEAIISYVGEVGWNLIEQRGGWINICNAYYSSNDGTFIAQLRECANHALLMHQFDSCSETRQLDQRINHLLENVDKNDDKHAED